MFSSIKLAGWRQFEDVDIEFHERLTVLTGANGAGKTTIIHILNRHWGWDIPYVAALEGRGRKRRYWTGFWGILKGRQQDSVPRGHVRIGELAYRSGEQALLTVPEEVSTTFGVNIHGRQQVKGVYVSSHRPLYLPHPVDQVPTKLDIRNQIFQQYWDQLRSRYNPNSRVASASFHLKQALISLATFGYGNEAVTPDPEARELFEGFQKVLVQILPNSLGFTKLLINMPDVVLSTRSGDFSLDAVSGGIAAMIDIAWQIHLYSHLEDKFVVAIDEPEAHLHPELQRIVIPRLLDAFPSAQFVVATHNPFVVGSVRDSKVYALRYGEEQKVTSVLLDDIDKAGTSNDILREVLGVESASGEWVSRAFETVMKSYLEAADDREVAHLRTDLEAAGLARYVPDGLAWLAEDRGGAD